MVIPRFSPKTAPKLACPSIETAFTGGPMAASVTHCPECRKSLAIADLPDHLERVHQRHALAEQMRKLHNLPKSSRMSIEGGSRHTTMRGKRWESRIQLDLSQRLIPWNALTAAWWLPKSGSRRIAGCTTLGQSSPKNRRRGRKSRRSAGWCFNRAQGARVSPRHSNATNAAK